MKVTCRFFVLYFLSFSYAIATPVPSKTPSQDQRVTTTSSDGITTVRVTRPDGTTITTTTNPDTTILETITKRDGTTIETINNPDGTTIKTINKADGTTIKTIINADGLAVATTIAADGTITVKSTNNTAPAPENTPTPSPSALPSPSTSVTPEPSSAASPSAPPTSSASPTESSSSSASPTPTPSPTPPPSQPVKAPFYIDRVKCSFSKEDPSHFFLMSASCITADQWAAFLNAVAKYSDKHGLYAPEMATLPRAQTDASGKVVASAPKRAQIIRSLAADKKGCAYSVLNRDQSACIPGAIEIKNKDLPVTSINLFDAARFCNWLHHGQPIIEEGQDPDEVTEGGAYLLDDGLNTYWRDTHQGLPGYLAQYQDQFKAITLLPNALWRLPSYYHYKGIHHAADPSSSIPDFTEPGGELSNQSLPLNEQDGFFDHDIKNWLKQDAPYEWTATHSSNPHEAERYHRDPQLVGSYYKIKSSSEETKEYAVITILNPLTHQRSVDKSKDSATSFRVMPLGSAAEELPPEPIPQPAPEPSPDSTPASSPEAAPGTSSDNPSNPH